MLASFVVAVLVLPWRQPVALSGSVPRRCKLFDWISVGTVNIPMALRMDPLSITMMLVITGVGSLIHVYSIGYMADDERLRRFFTYLNLFMFAMLILVLGEQLRADFRGLGRRRPLLLPADRLLVRRECRAASRQEGVPRQPRRRLRLPARHVRAFWRLRHASAYSTRRFADRSRWTSPAATVRSSSAAWCGIPRCHT